jgi:hypothetical protein
LLKFDLRPGDPENRRNPDNRQQSIAHKYPSWVSEGSLLDRQDCRKTGVNIEPGA